MTFSRKGEDEGLQYIVTDELAIATASKERVFEQLRKIAKTADHESGVESCWVLDREVDKMDSEIVANNVYVFLRFQAKAAYELYKNTTSRVEWEAIDQLTIGRRTTTWEEAGIGFLGR